MGWQQIRIGTAEVLRRFGVGAAALHVLHHGLNRLLAVDCLVVSALQAPANGADSAGCLATSSGRQPAPEHSASSIRVATRADLLALRAEGGWGIDEARLRRLDQGDRCLLSFEGDRCAGYSWVHAGGGAALPRGLRLGLPAGLLYSYDAYTHPDFRGRQLQSARHHAALARLEWQGCAGLLAYASQVNFASRRGQARGGMRPVGRIWLVGRGERPWVWCSAGVRRLGLRVSAPVAPTAAAPVLPLGDAGAAAAV